MRKIGIMIIALGFGVIIYSAISYFRLEKVQLLGAKINTKPTTKDVNWIPYTGITIMLIGSYFVLKSKDSNQ